MRMDGDGNGCRRIEMGMRMYEDGGRGWAWGTMGMGDRELTRAELGIRVCSSSCKGMTH